jgi:hypothetical protein
MHTSGKSSNRRSFSASSSLMLVMAFVARSASAAKIAPKQRVFGDRALGEAAVDGVDESSAAEDAVLDAADDSLVVFGEWGKAGRLREVFDEKAGEVEPAGFPSLWVDRLGNLADVGP